MGRLAPASRRRDPVRPPPGAVGRVQPLLRDALVRGRRRPADQGGRTAPQRPQHRVRHLQEPPLRRRPRRGPLRGLRDAHRRRVRDERPSRPLEAHDPVRRRVDRGSEGHRRRPARRACSRSSTRPSSSSSPPRSPPRSRSPRLQSRSAHRPTCPSSRSPPPRWKARSPPGKTAQRLSAANGCSIAWAGGAAPDFPARHRRAGPGPGRDRRRAPRSTTRSWVDLAPGWLRGGDTLLVELVDAVEWQQGRRWMYDRMVDDPRLTSLRTGAPTGTCTRCSPSARAALEARYGVRLSGPGVQLLPRRARQRRARTATGSCASSTTRSSRSSRSARAGRSSSSAKAGGPSRDLGTRLRRPAGDGWRDPAAMGARGPEGRGTPGPRISVSWRWSSAIARRT